MQAHYVLSITYIVLGITLKQVYLCVQVLGQRWESVRLWIDSSNVSLCSEIIIIPRVVERKDYGMGKNQFVACHPNFYHMLLSTNNHATTFDIQAFKERQS